MCNKQVVLDYLQVYGYISVQAGNKQLYINDVGREIRRLKQAGIPIRKTWHKSPQGKRYAQWHLDYEQFYAQGFTPTWFKDKAHIKKRQESKQTTLSRLVHYCGKLMSIRI